jgi:LysM repeat protein
LTRFEPNKSTSLHSKSVVMKQVSLAICILFAGTITLHAQATDLIIKNSTKGPYVDHTVTAKENFYSIGRLFYVHPRHLANFNSLDMKKGLSIGQVIKIPLTDTNFNQTTENGLPVYYITGNSESLYRVSTNNRNVLMEKLVKWNNLSSENVGTGTKLIVGFLASNDAAAAAVTKAPKTEPKKQNDQANKKEIAGAQTVTKQAETNDATVKPVEPVKDPEVEQIKAQATAVQKKEEVTPILKTAQQNSNQGFFKASFERQITEQPISKEQTVTSGIFKTASGWTDAKYYLLMNGIEPGTVVRITNPANNRIIYAKLLGEMNGLKQNEGLSLRVSNAAASALGVTDTDKFILRINY